jgi:UDP-GlcNAc3NAcA epimerase
VLFAPTQTAVDNLANEGRPPNAVVCTGDVMYDAALMHGAAADARSNIRKQLALEKGRYILATVHRAENTDDRARLRVILGALGALSRSHDVVVPLHPRTRQLVDTDAELRSLLDSARLLQPVGYLDMISLERGAALIITDSGGVQKEAFFHAVPCVTLREETEWPELIALGWNRLCALSGPDDVVSLCESAIGTVGSHARPYGEGDASLRIARYLAEHY